MMMITDDDVNIICMLNFAYFRYVTTAKSLKLQTLYCIKYYRMLSCKERQRRRLCRQYQPSSIGACRWRCCSCECTPSCSVLCSPKPWRETKASILFSMTLVMDHVTLGSIREYRKYINVVEPKLGTQWDHGPPNVPVQHLHMQLREMEMRLLTSCSLPSELWSWEPRYVKVSTTSTLLPPTWTVAPGGTVTSVVWILVFAQLMVSPRGCASSFITSRARTSTDSISAKRATSSAMLYQLTCLPFHGEPCALGASPLGPETHREQQRSPDELRY